MQIFDELSHIDVSYIIIYFAVIRPKPRCLVSIYNCIRSSPKRPLANVENNMYIFLSGRNIGYEVYKGLMGEELFKQKTEEFEKVYATFLVILKFENKIIPPGII